MFKWLISEEDTTADFDTDKGRIHRYYAETTNQFSVNEVVMNRCDNNFVFEVSVIEKTNQGYIFDWLVREKNMYKGMEYLSEHIPVLEKLAGIKDHLKLLVGKHGQILQVLNQAELHNKWNDLKKNLYEKEEQWPIDEEHKKKFIADGDLEHSINYPLERNLNQDPVLSTFFFQNTMEKKKEMEDTLVRTTELSNILMTSDGQKLPISLIQSTSWNRDAENAEWINFVITRTVDKAKLDHKAMIAALKNFPFAKQEVGTYIYDYTAEYTIHETNYLINKAKYGLLEKINHDVEVNHTCTITAN